MTKKEIFVTKRDGSKEPLDIEKIHKVLEFACDGLSNVSVSSIAVGAHLNFYNGIKTSDIHDVLIRTAANMISEETPNYQYVAGRLENLKLRKEVYGKWEPDHLYDIVKRNVEDGWYDKALLEDYTEEEYDYFNKHINHDNDQLFTYAAWKQLLSKYLVKNRVTGEFKETPQIMYMLIPMTIFAKYPKEQRKKIVVDFYKMTSKAHKSLIGLPTPILGGVRTPTRQFSSCVVGKCGDDLDSITATADAIVHYVSKRAGIGWDISRIRPLGSPIRGGEAYHTGLLPFIKLFQSATHSCSQGALRAGAATVYYPIFHMEIENLLVLKNNKGTEDSRARHLDYGVQINEHFYRKAYNKEDYYLFDQNQVPDLYDAFFNDSDKFEELYEKYSKKRSIRKKKVNAFELLTDLVNERSETGRIYIFNVDNVNKQKPMKSTVYSSNLCLEISLATENITKLGTFTTEQVKEFGYDPENMSMEEFRETFGEIALCTLGNINWGQIKTPDDFEKPIELLMRFLDELLDYQDYPMVAAEIPAKKRRQIGIGINNLAYFLAKNGKRYGEDLDWFAEYMESMYYYAMKANVKLAEEKGKLAWYDDTIYTEGKLIFDLANEHALGLFDGLKRDWTEIREKIKSIGVRFGTTLALMPAESNSLLINATNGVEPVRSRIVTKSNKEDSYKQALPKAKYDYLWDMPDMQRYLKTIAVIQVFTDQSISTNTSYSPKNYPKGMIPFKVLVKDIYTARKLGIKTLYYHNTDVGNDTPPEVNCAGGACTL